MNSNDNGGSKLNELSWEIHTNAKQKGFWEEESLPTKLALIHAEVSEALEELRTKETGEPPYYEHSIGCMKAKQNQCICVPKPEGFAVELVDVLIRTLDILAYLGEDVDKIVKDKMRFNAHRSRMHGKRF